MNNSKVLLISCIAVLILTILNFCETYNALYTSSLVILLGILIFLFLSLIYTNKNKEKFFSLKSIYKYVNITNITYCFITMISFVNNLIIACFYPVAPTEDSLESLFLLGYVTSSAKIFIIIYSLIIILIFVLKKKKVKHYE